ncbi:hypothetical protein CH341_22530 [Rhodoplanes roseus]|uniref:STAS domain-containing protein n=1 Tax=Rhodoplanes roseus TaxID=29409 RepID=A0A327L076_9BRAD|nr:hypothetical protein CH341_22530 [Rhodoplanes roseus]
MVELAGAQTVRTIGAAHDRLRTEIEAHAAVRVRLDGIEDFDLSLIQLLLAARRAAGAAGKSLTLASPATGALRTALDRAGFLASDPADPLGGPPFWLQASDLS